MSEHIESLADRLSEAFGEPTAIPLDVKALLWEIDAEAWERGVMWKGGIGTVKPERTPNPYLEPPLVLPTQPTWGVVIHRKHGLSVNCWYLEGDELMNVQGGSFRAHSVVDFVTLTDEQATQIKAAL